MKIVAFDRQAIPYYRVANGETSYIKYNGVAVAPHARVARQTHTIVGNDSVYAGYLSFHVRRVTAGGTPGVITVEFTFNPNIADVVAHTLTLSSNVAGAEVSQGFYLGTHFRYPVNLKIWTTDTSVGGTVDYNLFVSLFDYLDE